MKKPLSNLLIVVGLLAVLVGCNDDITEVGETLSPTEDAVNAKMDTLNIEASTVMADSVFSRSTYTLLGDLQDPVYGHLKTDYIAQLQGARGFKFAHEPKDGKIDSIEMVISYGGIVGDSTAWMRASVFEVKSKLPRTYYSTDISDLIKDKKFLGATTYQAIRNRGGEHEVRIKLPKALGQKIYDLSKQGTTAFDTDESFYQNILGGLYVTTTTGTGNILSVYNNRVDIYYQHKHTYKDKEGQDSVGWMDAFESFTNTKRQILVNHFEYEGNKKLVEEGQGSYTYIKSPAGVLTKLRITKEDLQKLVTNNKQARRVVNQAILNIETEQSPKEAILNPPRTLVLLPKDSVKNFFEGQFTEKDQIKTTYISNNYSFKERNYRFGNIARMIDLHILNNTKDIDGRKVVTEDLVLYLVPTRRTFKNTGYGGNIEETVNLDNFIFPSAVKLFMGKTGLRIGVITTSYN